MAVISLLLFAYPVSRFLSFILPFLSFFPLDEADIQAYGYGLKKIRFAMEIALDCA